MRSFLRRLAVACLTVVVLTVTAVVVGKAYEQHEFDKSRTISISNGVLTPSKPGKAANYLLIGSDSRAGETPQEQQNFGSKDVGGGSDVMMVLHIEPALRTGLLVSFPRDLVVDIPGHGRNLLNATYNLGGPDLVIRTIEQDFGLPIHHYLEVGFNGFRQVVNAIGRIHLFFPTPVHDPYSGLNVDRAGCVSVDGDRALAYARSRHYYVPKNLENPTPWQWDYPNQRGGYGWTATGSDLDRIPRQQYFLRTISQAAIDKAGSDPFKIRQLMDAVFKNFAHDQHLKVDELNNLVRTFNGLDPARVEMITLPNQPATGRWTGHVEEKDPDAALVLQRLKEFHIPPVKIPVPLPQGELAIRVVNGSGVKGLAARALQDFVDAGFQSAGPPQDADRSDFAQTQVRAAPGKDLEGYSVALAAGVTHFVNAKTRTDALDADVLVIVGRDWDSLPHNFRYAVSAPRSTTSLPHASTTTSVTGATRTTATGASTTTTTIARPTVDRRLVPVDPKTGGPLVGCPTK
jgi:LCP family protein required for cell wall assembly